MRIGFLGTTLLSLLLAACAAPTPRQPLRGHLSTETLPKAASGTIPAPVRETLALPAPRAKPKAETYSVVVNNVQVRDLLFALARDAKVNVDIHPGITGAVSLNAINQTLPQLLTRIAKQVDLRFQLDGPNLSVMPDTPYLKSYKVDYVNLSRNVTSAVSTDTQIATTGISTSGVSTGGAGLASVGGSGGNVSSTRIEDSSKNQFWISLEKNIKDILRETDKVFPAGVRPPEGGATAPDDGGLATRAVQALAGKAGDNAAKPSASGGQSSFREAASVIVNAETGIVTVRATQRQHEKIREFLDRVINSAHRQVQIEATIVEVTLNDGYSQGIDWTALRDGGIVHFLGAQVPNTTTNLTFTKTNNNPTALISLLSTFGTSKVLSSPRISALNNQTALLKVVENVVYFNVKEDVASTSVAGAPPTKAITTTPQTVSIGLVLSVTPQISDTDQVTLNVRPTITSITGYVQDPNPDLTIPNRVPQIRTREVESVMRVASGNTAILGGLMEDSIDYQNQRVPLIGQIPLIGELANNRNNTAVKKELVIFLRPVVVKEASLDGDYADMRRLVPDETFFRQPAEAQPFNVAPSR